MTLKYKILSRIAPLFLIGCWLLFLLMHLGAVPLFDWDEVNFAASAREMLITGDWQRVTVNFEPFGEKPPLFIWMQTLSMYVFGVGTWGARFPNALAGICTLWVLYRHAPRLYMGPMQGSLRGSDLQSHTNVGNGSDQGSDPRADLRSDPNADPSFYAGADHRMEWRKAEIDVGGGDHRIGWPLILMSGTLPFMYFRSGIIDPWFNLFMLLSILAMSRQNGSARKAGLEAGAWAGLAVLTKGPVGLLIPSLVAGWMLLLNPSLRKRGFGALPFFLLSSLLVASLWFLPETFKNGLWFLRSFLVYQWELLRQPVAGHYQPWYYHLVVVFLGCFPFSLWAIPEAFRWRRREGVDQSTEADAKAVVGLVSWMQATLWVVLVLFSLVSTKIIHYSSMAWVPLSALAWVGFQKSCDFSSDSGSSWRTRRLTDWRILLLIGIGIVVGLVWLMIAGVGQYPEKVAAYFREGNFEWGMLTYSRVDWPIYTYLPGMTWITVCLIAAVFLLRRNMIYSLRTLAVGLPATLWFVQILLLPRIEKMVQGPLRQWCEQHANRNETVVAWGYRSYAPFWYNRWTPDRRQVGDSESDTNQRKMLYVMRIDRLKDSEVQSRFELLEQQGGFALMRLKLVENYPNSNR
ncbi:MAG: hypothetical protein FJ344_02195 [Sphingomonadales bacterium]|nr:hypothetical protein [Sphingomonadales bacterium]